MLRSPSLSGRAARALTMDEAEAEPRTSAAEPPLTAEATADEGQAKGNSEPDAEAQEDKDLAEEVLLAYLAEEAGTKDNTKQVAPQAVVGAMATAQPSWHTQLPGGKTKVTVRRPAGGRWGLRTDDENMYLIPDSNSPALCSPPGSALTASYPRLLQSARGFQRLACARSWDPRRRRATGARRRGAHEQPRALHDHG